MKTLKIPEQILEYVKENDIKIDFDKLDVFETEPLDSGTSLVISGVVFDNDDVAFQYVKTSEDNYTVFGDLIDEI